MRSVPLLALATVLASPTIAQSSSSSGLPSSTSSSAQPSSSEYDTMVYPMDTQRSISTNVVSPVTLSIQQDGVNSTYSLEPAFNDLDPSQKWMPVFANPLSFSGDIAAASANNYTGFHQGMFAYISCDPDDYPGELDAVGMLDQMAAALAAGGDPASAFIGSSPFAVVLYTTRSEWCCLSGPNPFGDAMSFIFSTTSGNTAQGLLELLSKRDPGSSSTGTTTATVTNELAAESATSTGAAAAATTTGSSGGTGASPTTTVAMIILYSITGLITLCFMFIIVTGAVRAHRHPERYRQRATGGGPGTGRARGIARAMLDSIPIVKFGETEPKTTPAAAEDGIELESGLRRSASASGDNATERQHDDGTDPQESHATAEEATIPAATAADTREVANGEPAEPEEGASTDIKPKDPASTNTVPSEDPDSQAIQPAVPVPATGDDETTAAEAGLACSVCTDDFIRGEDTRVLPCGHKFHPACIDPWLLNVSGTCPLCRVDLNPPRKSSVSSTSGTPVAASVPSTSSRPPIVGRTFTVAPPRDPWFGTGPYNIYRRPEAPETLQQERSSRSLSLYIRSALDRRRMRDATPAERVSALREVRRQMDGEERTQDGTGEVGATAASVDADASGRSRPSSGRMSEDMAAMTSMAIAAAAAGGGDVLWPSERDIRRAEGRDEDQEAHRRRSSGVRNSWRRSRGSWFRRRSAAVEPVQEQDGVEEERSTPQQEPSEAAEQGPAQEPLQEQDTEHVNAEESSTRRTSTGSPAADAVASDSAPPADTASSARSTAEEEFHDAAESASGSSPTTERAASSPAGAADRTAVAPTEHSAPSSAV